MTNIEDLKRLPEHSRVVVIDNMADFDLWDRRKELGFSGLVLLNAVSAEELNFISDDISNVIDSSSSILFIQNFHRYSIGPDLKSNLEIKGYSKMTIDRVMQCCELLRSITDISDALEIKKNSEHPIRPHKHSKTLSLTFSGAGTSIVKESFKFTDDEEKASKAITTVLKPEDVYSFSAGDLIIFEDIWHIAPSLKKGGAEPPRTNLII